MTVEKVSALFSITGRGEGRKWIAELKKSHIDCHIRFSGKGTASSDMIDILGLENTDKDLILSFGSETAVNMLAEEMSRTVRGKQKFHGIMMVIPVEGISNLVAIMASRATEELEEKEMKKMENSEFDYSLILVCADRGYADSIMDTAKKAGATGGTVFRASLADAATSAQSYGVALGEEREVIAIMTPGSTRNSIMEAVSAEHGLRSPAHSIITSLPVNKAFKL